MDISRRYMQTKKTRSLLKQENKQGAFLPISHYVKFLFIRYLQFIGFRETTGFGLKSSVSLIKTNGSTVMHDILLPSPSSSPLPPPPPPPIGWVFPGVFGSAWIKEGRGPVPWVAAICGYQAHVSHTTMSSKGQV